MIASFVNGALLSLMMTRLAINNPGQTVWRHVSVVDRNCNRSNTALCEKRVSAETRLLVPKVTDFYLFKAYRNRYICENDENRK